MMWRGCEPTTRTCRSWRLPAGDGLILVHDAARPFITETLITRAIAAGQKHGAAVPGLPVADTVKQVGQGGHVTATLDRPPLRAIQTPQAFDLSMLRRAHAQPTADSLDDAQLVEALGAPVHVFAGDPGNNKITVAEDLELAALRMGARQTVRTGIGFDVHRFGLGNRVVLGGVAIPFHHALDGHSDADVVLHALTDALLGCIGDGDIGQHFKPTDPRWRGAASSLFLADAARRVRERGGVIQNLDAMVLAEAPKIGPHRDAMRQAIGRAAGITPAQVGIKATTMEGLGFVGRGEGISCLATATVSLPETAHG
jgi:2-C-methyl-D-erythritol 4-phosphate cytidylyltransferase / 2-C-methyl-D-erythritol 2,4-cyclodiphosphate synthase